MPSGEKAKKFRFSPEIVLPGLLDWINAHAFLGKDELGVFLAIWEWGGLS